MQKRKIQSPAEVGEAFDGRFADVPDQTMSLREVFGVAHGNHGVIHQREKAFIADDKGCANDERQVENCCGCQNEGEGFALG